MSQLSFAREAPDEWEPKRVSGKKEWSRSGTRDRFQRNRFYRNRCQSLIKSVDDQKLDLFQKRRPIGLNMPWHPGPMEEPEYLS